jgi:dihydroorotate dehydrogenase (fumarate)
MQISNKTVGGVHFEGPAIMVGAGVCKTHAAAKKWSAVAPVVLGSITPEVREGNQGSKLFYPESLEEIRTKGYGLNWFGMPNNSFERIMHELRHEPLNQNYPIAVSIAGFSVGDFIIGDFGFRSVNSVCALEFNFGCPNTEHGKIISFDLKTIHEILEGLVRNEPLQPIWLKFSPYSDPGQLREVAELVNDFTSIVKAVTTCNTFPNAYAGQNAISSPDGLAGLSGPALKPIALGQVIQFKKYLDPRIDVWGIGGITTGNDIADFFEAGADGVQMTSLPFWLGEPRGFLEGLAHSETGDRLQTLLAE